MSNASSTSPSRSPSPPIIYIRASDLWFDDGSVVLLVNSARDEEDTVGFRVHRSILAKESQYFADMFARPQSRPMRKIEGCPVVKMPDNEEDVKHLLHYLYDASYISDDTPHEMTMDRWNKLSSALCMSTKYNIPTLRRKVLRILSFYWPQTLVEFDHAWSSVSSAGCAYAAIALAREADVPQLLPCAFYQLAVLSPTTLQAAASWSRAKLSGADLERLLVGKEALRTALRAVTCPYLFDPDAPGALAPGCTAEDGQCRAALAAYAHRLRSGNWVDTPEVLSLELERSLLTGTKLCPACKKQRRDALARGRAEVWDTLPTYFQLASWDKLAKGET